MTASDNNSPAKKHTKSSRHTPSRRALLTSSGLAAAGLAVPGTVGITTSMASPAVPEFTVSHGASTSFNWHIFKDSPNGNKVLYVRYRGSENPPAGTVASADIWYANPDGTGRTKIIGSRANNHTGALQQWVDNQRIVHRAWNVVDGNNVMVVRVVNIDGTVEHVFRDVPDAIPIHFHDGTGMLLAGRRAGATAVPMLSDVWILDPLTGGKQKILDASAFTPWKSIIGGDVEDWRIWHRYFNPAGTLIWVKVVNPAGGEHAFTFNTAGEDIVHWNANEDPAGHPTWWDNTRIWHPRSSRIFERDGTVSVSAPQAGEIGHGSISPSRQLLAGESRSGSSPVKLWLYEQGNTTPLETLYSTTHTSVIWTKSAHVNPSFSRDGQKLYATKPVAANETRLVMYDVSAL
jgi:hypothetical protein